MQRRKFLRSSLFGTLGMAALGGAACRTATARPNVLVILTDDQGWGDLSVHGNTNLATPHIDSLAKDGALFEHFYACAVCAPTRAEFLTGRYHPRGGVRGVSTGAERLNLEERTIANVFQEAGYATACFGKWHNGSQHPYHPNSRGFEEYYGFTSGHWGDYFDPELDHNGELTHGKGFLVDDLTDHAIAFMKQQEQKPFFCYLPLNTPHSPMQVPDRFYEKFATFEPSMKATDATKEDVAMTRAALAMCENIDWNVGRLLSALDEMNQADNTIVVYFGDNGPNSWRWNGGMKGRKGNLDEGGLRVPCLMRWKGQIARGARITPLAAAIDLLPTLADLAGVPVSGTKPLDGLSLKPLLSGKQSAWPDRRIFSMQNRRASVRTQQFRLDPDGALFDMVADPGQTRDIAATEAAVAAELRAAAAAWQQEMVAALGEDTRPFPVGYAENTLLPARDGVPVGGIQRSSRHPNCSFFTNWTSTADAMEWNVDVGRSGRFAVTVYYTCPESALGSRIALVSADKEVSAHITEAHDPPIEGEADDRVPRTESYVKDFRPLLLGEIELTKGRGKLALRALEIPRKQVADVRQIALRYAGETVV